MMSVIGVAYIMNFVSLLKSVDPNNHPAEDSKIGTDDNAKEKYAEKLKAHGGVDRWTRIAVNQGENFPLHLFTLWGATAHAANKTHAAYCAIAYLVFRFLFNVCYLLSLSPWRTIVFLLSQVTVITAAVFGILGAKEEQDTLAIAMMSVSLLFVVLNFVARFQSVDPNNHPAEDAKLGLGQEQKDAYYKKLEDEGVNRWHRIAENQAEQLPYALFVFLGAWLVGGNTAHILYCVCAYAALRLLFITCYLLALAPWRSICFVLGQVCVVAAIVIGIVGCGSDFGNLSVMSCTGLLFLVNTIARLKSMNPNNHPAEDAALGVDDKAKQEFAEKLKAQGGVDRWTRIAVNQGENFPLAFLVLWAAWLGNMDAMGSQMNMNVSYCFIAYAVLRMLFVICYLFALTPARSIMFLLGHVTCFVAIGFGVNCVL